MIHSTALRAFVAAWEELRLDAYPDSAGVWTIGYGHTDHVMPNDRCTEAQADAWLDRELLASGATVHREIDIPLIQQRHDALVSLVYNIGARQFHESTILRLILLDRHDAACNQFARWNKSRQKTTRGLLARRAGESLIYAFGDYSGR